MVYFDDSGRKYLHALWVSDNKDLEIPSCPKSNIMATIMRVMITFFQAKSSPKKKSPKKSESGSPKKEAEASPKQEAKTTDSPKKSQSSPAGGAKSPRKSGATTPKKSPAKMAADPE